MVYHMKTTIDLPDDLLMEAKTAAILRKTTLRQLVARGLRRELQSASEDEPSAIRSLRRLDAGPWRGVSADHYVEDLRRNWA